MFFIFESPLDYCKKAIKIPTVKTDWALSSIIVNSLI